MDNHSLILSDRRPTHRKHNGIFKRTPFVVVAFAPHHKITGLGHGDGAVTKHYFKLAGNENTDRRSRLTSDPFGPFFSSRVYPPLQLDFVTMSKAKLFVDEAADKPAPLCVYGGISNLDIRLFCHRYKYSTQADYRHEEIGSLHVSSSITRLVRNPNKERIW